MCQPYRARTKGKTESGVGYVRRNALAGLAFARLATSKLISRGEWSKPTSECTVAAAQATHRTSTLQIPTVRRPEARARGRQWPVRRHCRECADPRSTRRRQRCALGRAVVQAGHSVFLVTATTLIAALAHTEGNLSSWSSTRLATCLSRSGPQSILPARHPPCLQSDPETRRRRPPRRRPLSMA